MIYFVLLLKPKEYSGFVYSSVIYLVLIFSSYSEKLYSDDLHLSNSNLGGIGLIQTPTARFTNDSGRLSFGVSSVDPYNKITASMQLLPWLEGSIVYTEINNRLYNIAGFMDTESKYIKSFEYVEETEEERILDPSAKDSTELGEVPQEEKKGTLNPGYPGYYYGLAGMYRYE